MFIMLHVKTTISPTALFRDEVFLHRFLVKNNFLKHSFDPILFILIFLYNYKQYETPNVF